MGGRGEGQGEMLYIWIVRNDQDEDRICDTRLLSKEIVIGYCHSTEEGGGMRTGNGIGREIGDREI